MTTTASWGWKLLPLAKAACQVPSVLTYNTVLNKPYRRDELARSLRLVLNGGAD